MDKNLEWLAGYEERTAQRQRDRLEAEERSPLFWVAEGIAFR